MSDRNMGVGLPTLIEQLSGLLDEPVVLTFAPPPAGDHIRWRVYAGQQDSSKGTLGEGPTVYMAMKDAFDCVIRTTFEGKR